MVWSLLGDNVKEHWKEIENYEDYLISDHGRVFSCKRKKFLKPQKNRGGYLFVNLYKNGVHKHYLHRLVALAFIENPENKRTVNHIDGCKTNNHISNLEWNTYSENVQHSFDNGLQKPVKGSKNGQAKLSENQVLEIRRLHEIGEYTQRALGKIFGVHRTLISFIINRKSWNHI